MEEIELENRYNSNFNALRDPDILRLSQSVGPE
jgi:hypothetical protein